MHDRFNFLGVKISVTNFQLAFKKITSLQYAVPAYICFPDASVVAEASKNPGLTSILNGAMLTMPDGKPSQLAARLQGYREVSTVSGYDLCNALLGINMTHYFYGGDAALLKIVKANIMRNHPNAKVLGYHSPPYIPLASIESSLEIAADIEEIRLLKPDLVWVGISSPKQDYLMHYFHTKLDTSLMLGVGGVFLYLADTSSKSPEWVKKAGLRWLFRLIQEPGRLWPKYFGTVKFLLKNSGFFIAALTETRKPPRSL